MTIFKSLREQAGKTLREVEALTGISNAYISQLENGKISDPSVKTIFLLSKLYGVTVEHIMLQSGVEYDIKKLEMKITVEDRLKNIEDRLKALETRNIVFGSTEL